MCFKQEETFSTPCGKPLKYVGQFTYLGSNILFTERDVNICLAKRWNAIDWLLVIWKSNLFDKIKRDFFHITVWMHHIDTNKMHGEKARWKLCKNAAYCLEQILEAAPHKTATVWSPTSYLTNHLSKTNKTCETLLEKQRQTHKWRFLMDSYTYTVLTSKDLLTSTLCRHRMQPRGSARSDGW